MNEMCKQEAIDIIKAERECVYRQGRTGECCRDDMGCGACDLVQEDTDIMEAYDMAIEALKEQRPHGEWEGDPERKKMVTRICTSCGDRSVVGYFCMWCGADMRWCGADMRQKEGDKK